MHYEHPLAFALGLEGMALMRAFNGEFGREFVEARFEEVRRLLDDESLRGKGLNVGRVNSVDGYRVWSRTYDNPDNGLFDLDAPIVCEILGAQPQGVVLDAACGTGRLADDLVKTGHRVIGVDSSPDMLTHARERAPAAEFRVGDLHDLPLDAGEVDAVVCGLALTHVADLAPVLAEFARVLRTGGHLVISDVHPELVSWGSIPKVVGPDGAYARIATYRHRPGDYLRAALPLGFEVRRCEEPRFQARMDDRDNPPRPMPDQLDVGPWADWPWSLTALVPAASTVAGRDMPSLIIWHFQLAGG